MSQNQEFAESGPALLALLAYQNLCVAESLLRSSADSELADRVAIGRLGADALARFTQACDYLPGGQQSAVTAMAEIASPVDEFWLMTRPRTPAEGLLRLAAVASLEVELLQHVKAQLGEFDWEAITPSAGLWRAIDHGGQVVVAALGEPGRVGDELSLYARRLLGESAVMCQRLVVRQPALRRALTGQPDFDLSLTSGVLDLVLAGVATRLGQLGLAV